VLFLATTAAAAWQTLRRRGAPAGLPSLRVTAVLGAAALVAWASSIQIAGMTPWAVVFRLVPGASAIRVPVRINWRSTSSYRGRAMVFSIGSPHAALGGRARRRRFAIALSGRRAVNAMNPFRWAGARGALLAIPDPRELGVLRRPGADERSAGNIATPTLTMLPGVDGGVPTINGYSGNSPRGWGLEVFDADYPKHVARWIADHHLARGMCILDLEHAEWSAGPPPRRGAGGAAT
jgi:hypothetical protein